MLLVNGLHFFLNSSLANRTETTDGEVYYPDKQDGKYGMNTDVERGADTFIPFSKGDNKHVKFKEFLSFEENDGDKIIEYTFEENIFSTILVTISTLIHPNYNLPTVTIYINNILQEENVDYTQYFTSLTSNGVWNYILENKEFSVGDTIKCVYHAYYTGGSYNGYASMFVV